MMPDCPQCGTRMHLDDETTKLLEFRCTECYKRLIEPKPRGKRLAHEHAVY